MQLLSFLERRMSTASMKPAKPEVWSDRTAGPKNPPTPRPRSMLKVKLPSRRTRRRTSTDGGRPESSYTDESNLLLGASPPSPALRSKWFDEEEEHSTKLCPSPVLRSGWFDEPEVRRTKRKTWLKRLLSGRRSSSKEGDGMSGEEDPYMLGLDESESMHWVTAERNPRFCLGTHRQSAQAEVVDPFMTPPRHLGHYAESFYSKEGMDSRLSISSWQR